MVLIEAFQCVIQNTKTQHKKKIIALARKPGYVNKIKKTS